jgi:hypothetical protein
MQQSIRAGVRAAIFSCTVTGLLLGASSATWTKVNNPIPPGGGPGRMMLLTDGTVMMQSGIGQNWVRLTPDIKGSYINGSWTSNPINPMSANRFSFASEVLTDGRVWILGGENYGPNEDYVWTATGEIWNPLTNTWSPIETFPPQSCFNVTYHVPADTTSGSPVITHIPTTVTPTFLAGWAVAGSGIPANASITSVDSSSQVHISADVSATQSGVTLAFSGTPTSCYGDVPSMLLASGKILTGSLVSKASYIYSVATNSWNLAADKVYNDSSDEEGWTKLSDGKILTYDIGQSTSTGESYAEVYDPSRNEWSSISPADGSAHGTFPLLSSSATGYELGPSLRLLDGRSFLVGATGHTALYTPSTNTWAAGPDIMGSLHGHAALFGADDAPAAIMPNGHVLLAADSGPSPVQSSGNVVNGSNVITHVPSTAELYVGWPVTQTSGTSVVPSGTTITSIDSSTQIHISQNATGGGTGIGLKFGGTYSPPTQLFDFNPATDTIEPVSPAFPESLATTNAYATCMLVLPTGQVLFEDGADVWIYTPSGEANSSYEPVTTKVAYDGHGVFTLTGKQLTGQSAGAAYGDDAEMDENYPIIRLVNSAGKVYYCRTTNWSSTGVATGSTLETVNFTLNSTITAGDYSLIVSAAGISSAPTSINITQAEVGKE